jgi:hypothetical protein
MREETRQALVELIVFARATGDPNTGEAARVVERDLLNGGLSQLVERPVSAKPASSPAPKKR